MKGLRLLVATVCFGLAWFGMSRMWTRLSPEAVAWMASVCVLAGLWIAGRAGMPLRGRARAGMEAVQARLGYVQAGLACCGIVAGFWLFLSARGPLEDRFLARDSSGTSNDRGEGQTGSGHSSGNWLWKQGVQRPLPRRTDFKPGRKPEVFLRPLEGADRKKGRARDIYVSAVAFDRYDDGIWAVESIKAGNLNADAAGRIKLSDRPVGRTWHHEVVLSSDTGPERPLVAVQGVVAVTGIPELERRADGLLILPARQAGEGYKYRAESIPRRLSDLAEETGEPPVSPTPAWLALPERPVAERLSDLAREMAGDGKTVAKLRRIESGLRDRCRYSLTTPNEEDLDPIENFLFGERSGHCEYFATAAALMARAVGVPSRVVYGWTGGTWHASAGWYVFRADEAHAWAEVLLDGGGWVVMDPTPPSRVPSRSKESAEPLPALGVEDEAATSEQAIDAGRGFPIWSGAGSAGLLVLGGWLGWRRRRGIRGGSSASGPVCEAWRRPVGGYLDEWRRALLRHGRGSGTGGTIKQQIRDLAVAPPFAADLILYHYRVTYEGAARDLREERMLARAIREWARRPEGISRGREPLTGA